MASHIIRLTALFAFIVPLVLGHPSASIPPHAKIRRAAETSDVVADSYIVVYNSNVTPDAVAGHLEAINTLLADKQRYFPSSGIKATYDLTRLKGYNVMADPTTITTIASYPDIDFVEPDIKVYATDLHDNLKRAALEPRISKTHSARDATATEVGAPWGLGRISHLDNGSTTYVYDGSAPAGTTVYVVDTGVYAEHEQFQGRASMGANFITLEEDSDDNGHGTHCSGTIGGKDYGVYKTAQIVGVKVLDYSGSGTAAGVISGIQWVTNSSVPHSVLSMSLGGGYSASINAAVASAVDAGITVVVAAGNANEDASLFSPASEPSAITVGATDSSDTRAYFSNFGPLLDVFAPGVDVLSAWIGSPNATNVESGTSMSTPHVAGLAAYLIALEGLATPDAVVTRISGLATSGKVIDDDGSVDLIAYNGSGE